MRRPQTSAGSLARPDDAARRCRPREYARYELRAAPCEAPPGSRDRPGNVRGHRTSYDVKKALPALYAPKLRGFHEVDVPELAFLMVDGHGDPNVSPAYAAAVTALYTLSYGVRAIAKAELGRVHTVGPLEGLWSADDPGVFLTREKSAWDWTMMISQPAWITPEIVDAAKRKKGVDGVRFASYAEGRSVQVLHVGPYDDEGPVLARLHREYLPHHGLEFNGRHHEIYLSDPRRIEPAKLRTILRQPVR